MYPWARVKKHSKSNVVPTFEDMKKPAVKSNRKPAAARKSLFEEIGETSQEQVKNKTKEVSFCVHCHHYKEEIDKTLKQKTEQQNPIIKLEETINKTQTKINNLHENITKLKNDTEITKSKMFSCKILAKIKKCTNL